MIKIGITGGIGSGKSTVASILKQMSVPVYISDAETKRLMVTDDCIKSNLVKLLGGNVYVNGGLNKELLASYFFANPEHAQSINAIVHPQVKKDFKEWVERQKPSSSIVGIESAILIEAGFTDVVDKIVLVDAPEEVRIQRAMERDKVSREEVEKRIRAQMSDERKREKANYVILNDGETPLIPQVLGLIASLSENIDYLCAPKKY